MRRILDICCENKKIKLLWYVLTLLVLSGVMVFYRLDVPQAIIFDETYHIPSAQKYLSGVFFQENHPPLGKLLIAFGYLSLYSDNITDDFLDIEKVNQDWPNHLNIQGYRISSAIFGVFLPALFFLLIFLITGRINISFFISLLLLFDTATLMQARIAMLDIFLIFFILLSLLFFYLFGKRDKFKFYGIIIWGMAAACAFSVKYTGLITIVPMAILLIVLVSKKDWCRSAILFTMFGLSFLATFLLIWQIHFFLSKRVVQDRTYNASIAHLQVISSEHINPVGQFTTRLIDSLQYHVMYNQGVPKLKLGDPDEIGSAWYQWLLGGKAINYRWETSDGIVYRYSYFITNPITWMVSFFGVILTTSLVISHVLFNFLPSNNLRTSMFIFVGLYWGYLIPFWFIQRVMYLYHYLPGMIIGLILFSIAICIHPILDKKHFVFALFLVVLMALIIFMLLSPFIYYQGLTDAEFQIRNFWPFWDIECISCR